MLFGDTEGTSIHNLAPDAQELQSSHSGRDEHVEGSTGMSDRPHSRATRADVARLANVSVASVSYALNNVPNKVSPQTAERIRRAAEILDYRPSTFARALKTGTSHTLGIIIPDFSNPYFAALSDEIEMAASKHGYSTLFASSHIDADTERSRIDRLQRRDVDAVLTSSILSDKELATIDQKHCRLVFFDHPTPMPAGKCVSTDFAPAVEQVVHHLLGHGHTNMAMLYGDANPADERVRGWIQSHKDAGLPVGRIARSQFTREGGYQTTLRLLADDDPPTAIFAASDLEALGALRAIHESGLNVPDDIALVSFDGTSETLYTWPQLTTMRQNTEALARHAVQAAIDPDNVPDVQLVPSELVIRHSCGC